ncbi:alpha/beta hydrolase [Planctomycetaceae bacterium SH139]
MLLLFAVSAAFLAPLAELYKGNPPPGLNSFLFFPTKYPDGDWDPPGLTYVDTYFKSEDETVLHGWYCPSETPIAYVLILHGNAGNISTRSGLLRLLQQANITAFIVDYRGYGRSSGSPSIDGVLQDVKAARMKFSEVANVPQAEMFLLGESLGGAFASKLAVDVEPRALILQSTFSSLRELADLHYPALSSLVSAELLNSQETLSDYDCPLLLAHGKNDLIVPHSHAVAIFSAARGPKQLVSLNQAGHNISTNGTYQSALLAFIKSHSKQKE